MEGTDLSEGFRDRTRAAIADAGLRGALDRLTDGFPAKRRAAIARFPEFEATRDVAVAMKDGVLAHLDRHLERFEAAVERSGGHVHWAEDGQAARAIVLAICRAAGAKTALKGKSMVSEEIGLNDFLAASGIEPVETDLGEYILQLRREAPSHIIAPAIHLAQADVATTFRAAHADRPAARSLETPEALLAEARAVLRRRFLVAEVAITGANLLIAETGTAVIVTNEGNADLSITRARVHIVLATIEKVVPTLADATHVLRLLARSATGQDISVYTTFASGPRRAGERDGAAEFHVVLLDNGRTGLLGGPFHAMLRCIKCGACLNHCPVYAAVGGHAYGSVYPGPMGSVLTPAIAGLAAAHALPDASTLCGRCEEVCPMRIPLPGMLRAWRERAAERKLGGAWARWMLALWAWLARRPRLYGALAALGVSALARVGRRGALPRLPFAGGWQQGRDLAPPEGGTFQARWRRERGR